MVRGRSAHCGAASGREAPEAESRKVVISMAPATPRPVVQMTGIRKEFPGVKALDGVDLRLYPGEVHALMGENGAGKSTLIKVLAGVYSIDGGEIVLADKPVHFSSPLQAQQAGV